MQSKANMPPVFMGVVRGNTVVLDGYDLSRYEGVSACVTLKNDIIDDERMTAFNNLLKFTKTVNCNIDNDDDALEAALWEKYESID